MRAKTDPESKKNRSKNVSKNRCQKNRSKIGWGAKFEQPPTLSGGGPRSRGRIYGGVNPSLRDDERRKEREEGQRTGATPKPPVARGWWDMFFLFRIVVISN